MDSTHSVEGYVACRAECGESWLIKEIAARTGGFCAKCWIDGLAPAVRDLEARADGSRVKIARKEKRERVGPVQYRGNAQNRTAAKAARQRAQSRLASAFPDAYLAILAQERQKSGLEPLSLELLNRYGSKTFDLAEVYAALEMTGVA